VRWKLVLSVLVAAAALGLAASGAHAHLAPERLRETLLDLGPWGPALFVLAFAVLEPLHVPGLLFILTAPLVWPFPMAFGLSLAGATGAGVVGYAGARLLGRAWVQRHLPAGWRAWDERLARHGFRTVVLIRLLTFLAPAAHWGIGLSSVRFGPALLGTVVGLAPGILLFTWLGSHALDALARVPRPVWLALALGVVVWLVVRRSRLRSRSERMAAS
jgi:uncharacterized membrane protein YdjX (TVP38/TMEM64 family)